MKIAFIAAGAAGRYCGNCLRDSALALALRREGHDVVVLPTYTPIRPELEDPSEQRVFLSGLRVWLEQRIPMLRTPRPWLDRLLGSRRLLALVSRLAARTDPADLGALTVSVLRGEEGFQRKEVDELASWLRSEVQPDIVHITNVLLVGLTRRLRDALGVPVVCGLQAEDSFLEFIPEPHRGEAKRLIRERGGEVDRLISVSEYYAGHCERTLGLPRDRMSVVLAGIPLDGHEPSTRPPDAPRTIGFLSRIAPEKGLDHLVEAFVAIAGRSEFADVRLRVAGFLGREQRAFARRLERRVRRASLEARFELVGTVSRAEKIAFLREIDVLAMPSIYPDPRGLSILEAMASGVPVVAPSHGAFPELVEATGGGVLHEPASADGLRASLEELLRDADRRRELGATGHRAVHGGFGDHRMARETLAVYEDVIASRR